VLLGILFAAVAATAALAADTAISMPRDAWPANRRITFTLIGAEPIGEVDPQALPDHLTCRIDHDGREYTVTARRIVEDGDIDADASAHPARAQYALDAPDGLYGTMILRIEEMTLPPMVIDVLNPEIPPAPERRYADLDSLFSLYQPYLGNIAAYEPMYFLVGTDPEKSKFQVSFKYRFFNPQSPFAQAHPWVDGFHLGYTQTSFWDLKSDSAPFEDTSYKPELFWLSRNLISGGSMFRGMFLQSGYQHESNGRGGDLSRSTNFLYLKPVFVLFSDNNQYGLQVAPKIWAYVNNDDNTNPDLEDYRGYFDLEVKVGRADSFVLGSSFRWAKEGASILLDLSYPVHRFLFDAVDIYLHAQYANALAESLIDYRERSHAFRLGFSIVR
jgi:outer membrane phospholipase A